MGTLGYQALYREWRPATFSEVSGQEHVKRTLTNMLRQGRVPHALLFSGPRGTGKTTMAKIMARAVNCHNGVTAEPCLKCPACLGVTDNTSLDVLEIDAASNRGIDEIRELREHVKFAPTQLRLKVYIIDEVHMLTTEAFNALLKTLEEPPSYVLFILATTEPHKLPATVISRCQRFDFRRIQPDSIMARLQQVAQAKGVVLTTEAARFLAQQAGGGMRDALGMLEQCMSYAEGQVDLEIVETVTGSVPTVVYLQLLEALAEGNLAAMIEQLGHELGRGREAGQYLVSYLHTLRMLLLTAHSPQVLDEAGYEEEQRSAFKVLAERLKRSLSGIIDAALHTENDMRYGGHPRLHLELLLVKQFESVHAQPPALASPVSEKPPVLAKSAAEKAVENAVESAPPQARPVASPGGPNVAHLLKVWPEVHRAVKQRAPLTGAIMGAASPLRLEGDTVILQMNEPNVHMFRRLSNPADLGHIAAGFQQVLGKAVDVKVIMPNGSVPPATPAASEDKVKQVLDIFQGTIVKGKE